MSEMQPSEASILYRKRSSCSIVASKAQLALGDITTSFETEARKNKITKKELLGELEKVRATRRKKITQP